ncbi:MAG: VWA domain-containing protein [Nannocystaceae bacterium]|nr:VWA domain-containing protein [Nannocystaceae bacterium]
MPRRPRALRLLPLLAVVALLSVFGRTSPPADPELVTLAAVAEREALPAHTATRVAVRIESAAAARSQDASVPVNLALVLDTSGSMVGAPIEEARAALHSVVDQLRPQDHLTIVTFDSRAQVVLPRVRLDDIDRDEIHERIDAVEARGTTDLAAGLGTALQQLEPEREAGDLDRLVLVGDGVPNDATPLPGYVEHARHLGVAITALGVGLDYDEVLLGRLARDTGGRFHHADCGEELATLLADEVFGAQRQVAGNVRLQLSTGPGVTIARIVGATGEMTGVHSYQVVLGDLAEGQQQDTYVELEVAPQQPGTTVELLDAIVAFDDRVGGVGRLERRSFIAMPVSTDLAVLAVADPDVHTGLVAARAAAATIDAIELSRKGQIDQAERLLEDNDNALDAAQQLDNDDGRRPQLEQQRQEITRLRGELHDYRVAAPTPAAPRGPELERAAKAANENATDLLQAH